MPSREPNLNTHGWTQEQLNCPHEKVVFSTDNSCGGWFETCAQCQAILDAGMMGHN